MSNGARLTAVIVVVAVAAIGLYFALTSPSQPAPVPATADSLTQPPPAEGLGELAGSASATAPAAPPADAFGTPSGTLAPAAGGAAAATIGGSGAPAAPASAPIGGSSAAPGGARPTGSAPTATVVMPVDPATWKAPADQAASKEYTIKSGDTLEAIARTELGSGQKWPAIVAANPGLNPKQLKVGQKIRIPDAGTANASPATETMKSADAGSGNSYTVQKGDTLFGIARKTYGSGSDAEVRRIVDANGGVLKSKDTPLKPGMKLVIPAKR